ncbi:MAG: N-formylglutamate amidohydrolase [Spirochaetes bacterium]|jgi:N-formylglutamate deformylase|nr:N-formylglutamate amidohydrolase [Spirochaetota bacterium]
MEKLPILIIIPHGGLQIPEELESHALTDRLELFLSSDACANELFNFEAEVAGVITTHISRLFVDLNREQTAVAPRTEDGVIKKNTIYGKPIYEAPYFPDEIATANIIKRYYTPFYNTIDKIIKSGEIRMIVECHTSLGIGLPRTPKADMPLPFITIHNRIERNMAPIQTCHDTASSMLLEMLRKGFSLSSSMETKISDKPATGSLIQTFAKYIPYLRLDISRSLFFDDRYFNMEYIKVDQLRIKSLRKKIWDALSKTYLKCI